jgi:hypothetical protein
MLVTHNGRTINVAVPEDKAEALKLVMGSYHEFRKRICGYKDFEQFHQNLLDPVLTSDAKSKLIIIPRNHQKSSAIMAYALWRIVKNPNLSILYESSVYEQARKYLGEMSNIISSEPWKLIFGDWKGSIWRDNELLVNKRKAFQPAPTISTSGIDKTQTGQHYDIIIADDIVDEHNSKTQDLREKVIDRYKQYQSLLRPGGELILTGTPWDEEDLYGWLHQEKQTKILGQFATLRIGAYDEHGQIRFKKKFCETIEEENLPENRGKRSFESLKITYGPYKFSCNYLCYPHRGDEAEFKQEWIKRSTASDCVERLKNRPGKVYIFVDPAMGKENSKEPCDAGIIVTHFMPDHMIDVLEDFTNRMTPGDIVEIAHVLASKYVQYTDVEVYIEDVGFQGVLITLLNERRASEGVYYLVSPAFPRGDKEKRIRALFPFYQFGQIRHSDNIKEKKLERQLIRFPLDRLRDAADAFSQFTYLLQWPMKKIKEEPDFIKEIPVSRFTRYAKPNEKKNQQDQTYGEVSYMGKSKGTLFDYS